MSRRQAAERGWRACGVLLAVALLLPGCNRSSLPAGPKGTVQGKVTYQGEAVPAGSIIMFVHAETGLPASAEIGAGGTYTLMMQGGDQIPAGPYAVSVTPPAAPEVSENADMEAYKAMMEGGAGASDTAATEPFPAKYCAAETSGVTFEVKEGANSFDLDMTDDA